MLPCRAEEDVEAGSAALRVDWPVYPRRAEHNTVAEGGNRRWAIAASSQIRRSPRSLVAFSNPTLPSDSVEAIASNAAWLMAMRTMRSGYASSVGDPLGCEVVVDFLYQVLVCGVMRRVAGSQFRQKSSRIDTPPEMHRLPP